MTWRAVFWLPALLWLSALATAQDSAMTFRVGPACGPDCTTIIAEGVIALESAESFRALAAQLGASRVTVQLSSAGGNLTGGIQLGNALREANAAVVVQNKSRCVSACVYTMLGGVTRRVNTSGRIGVHRFHPDTPDEAVPKVLADYVIDMLKRYVLQMGADATLIHLAANVAPDTVHYLSADELRRYRIITDAK
jgi:hypothetical protein